MTKRSKAGKTKPSLKEQEQPDADSEALIKEREHLQRALERIRNDRQRLQRRTNRLWAKVKSLNRVLSQSHQEPEYLQREE